MFVTIYHRIRGTVRRDFVQRITTRNGLRPTSGRIRKAAPVMVAPDIVTSTERRVRFFCFARASRSIIVKTMLCRLYTTMATICDHRATVYRCPLTW